jgi:hypothetical protein
MGKFSTQGSACGVQPKCCPPGAQTEHPGDAWPVSLRRGSWCSPATLFPSSSPVASGRRLLAVRFAGLDGEFESSRRGPQVARAGWGGRRAGTVPAFSSTKTLPDPKKLTRDALGPLPGRSRALGRGPPAGPRFSRAAPHNSGPRRPSRARRHHNHPDPRRRDSFHCISLRGGPDSLRATRNERQRNDPGTTMHAPHPNGAGWRIRFVSFHFGGCGFVSRETDETQETNGNELTPPKRIGCLGAARSPSRAEHPRSPSPERTSAPQPNGGAAGGADRGGLPPPGRRKRKTRGDSVESPRFASRHGSSRLQQGCHGVVGPIRGPSPAPLSRGPPRGRRCRSRRRGSAAGGWPGGG